MFKDEQTAGTQHSAVEHRRSDLIETGHVVGRIGEYEIEAARACGGEAFEHVATDQPQIVDAERGRCLFDEPVLRGGFLHGCHRGGLP